MLPLALEHSTPVDCRSHGDAYYDAVIYGPEIPADQATFRSDLPDGAARALRAEEMIQLFATLSTPLSPRTGPAFARRRAWNTASLATYARGLQHWLDRQVNRLPLVWLARQLCGHQVAAVPPLTWDDYAALLDHHRKSQGVPAAAQIEPVAISHVQSGHSLLHSAASSWNRLTLLFQMAVEQWERGDSFAKLATH